MQVGNCIKGLKRPFYGSALPPPTSLQPVTVLLHTGAHVLTFSLREEMQKTGLGSDGYRKLMEGTGLLLLPSQGEADRLIGAGGGRPCLRIGYAARSSATI